MSKLLTVAIVVALAATGLFALRSWLQDDAGSGVAPSASTPTTESESPPNPPATEHERPATPTLESPETARVATTGTIRGRVTDMSGAPLVASVSLVRSVTTTTTTESDGVYVLEHVPPGEHRVRARADGYFSGTVEAVILAAGATVADVDFQLLLAPTIEGRVVDTAGHPVVGASLAAHPANDPLSTSGRAGAVSGSDGRFTLFLQRTTPYTVDVTADAHEPWDEHEDRRTFPPGSRSVEIVLATSPRTRFVVLDAETGAPIERFALRVDEGAGSDALPKRYVPRDLTLPAAERHGDGSVEHIAREGVDRVTVLAEGWLPLVCDVRRDGPGIHVQTLALERGGGLRARVVRGGAPVVGADVLVEPLYSIARHGDWGPQHRHLARHRVLDHGRRSRTTTDEAGTFELRGLDEGGVRLRLSMGNGAPLVRIPVEIGREGVTDLGTLEWLDGASITGEVLLPRGVEPEGLHVIVDEHVEPRRVPLDALARFRIDDLAAGPHTLDLEPVDNLVSRGENVLLDLASGETFTVLIDAQDRGVCRIELTLLFGDVPVEGVLVNLRSNETQRRTYCGVTNQDGLVRRAVRALGEVVLETESQGTLIHAEPLFLEPGGSLIATVRFDVGELVLHLPAGVEWPTHGGLRLTITGRAGGRQTFVIPFIDGAVQHVGPTMAEGALRIPDVLAGPAELRFELFRESFSAPLFSFAHVGPLGEPDYAASATVTLAAGRATHVRLE